MQSGIFKLYPQYIEKTDRRKQDIPVEIDRRSGFDRRQSSRPVLDQKLRNDLIEMQNIFGPFGRIFEVLTKMNK